MNSRVLVIASSGGHLTQALCALSLIDNLYLVSNNTYVNDQNIRKIFKIMDTQHNALIHFMNIFYATYVFIAVRPKAVFSTGGPIVLPFALLCKVLGVRFVYLDTLSRVQDLSNTGKLILKMGLYDEFLTQWEHLATKYNIKYLGKTFVLDGNNG